MLERITLKFTESDPLELPVEGVTIFVGPNNSGKSLVLKEYMEAMRVHPFPQGLRILSDYEVKWPSKKEVETFRDKYARLTPPGLSAGHIRLRAGNAGGEFEYSDINFHSLERITADRHDKHWIATQFMRYRCLLLNGRSRFDLTNDQPSGDLLGPPRNVLQHLFQDDAARAEVADAILDAFGLHFVVDPTGLTVLRIRLSETAIDFNAQSLDARARSFYASAHHVKELSDGVQAFTGITTAVYSEDYDTILINEPEAFLHPPLARKLGRNLARRMASTGGAFLASTHSPEFLMGCVEASSKVRVVRLEYQSGKSRARLVDTTDLRRLLSHPIMRSANVAAGLFYDGVVVTESDNDRVFYSEIFHRLATSGEPMPSLLFVNAQNKQTMRDIVGPMRSFGVPTAAIADIDLVKDGGTDWGQWMDATNMPQALRAGYGSQRGAIKDLLDSSGKNMKRDGGIAILDDRAAAAAVAFFDQLDRYGLFTVRGGELEHWLTHLGVNGRKTDWALSMLTALGSDPDDPHYVRPSAGDVWDFMRKIVKWITDPSREGMP